MGLLTYHRAETLLYLGVATGAIAYAVWFVFHLLRRSRVDFTVGAPIAVGIVVKVATTVFVSLAPFAASVRGPDDEGILVNAQSLAKGSLVSSEALQVLTSKLHVWTMAAQIKLFGFPVDALRITQIGIAAVGLLLLVATVYDLAGPRPAVVAAWILAFEPATTFFSGVLHKEALMLLAIGLVAYGAVRLWRVADLRSLPLIVGGCAIAIATRPYAGWFLVASVFALVLHSAVRRGRPRSAGPVMLGLLASGLVLFAVPTLARVSSPARLSRLQISQQASTTYSSANLRLEPVDFSTRGGVVRDLPRRVRDVMLRPYPWQLASLSQRFGALGTLVALWALGYLIVLLTQNAGRVMQRAAPLMYPGVFLLVAYALSSGNAGTAFRYRTQLVALAICILVVLRETRTRPEEAAVRSPAPYPELAVR